MRYRAEESQTHRNGGIIRTRQYITTYNSLVWNDDDEAKRSEREQTEKMESKTTTARRKKNITSPRLLDCLFAIADVTLLRCHLQFVGTEMCV